jgi:signal transduction histidine kinase
MIADARMFAEEGADPAQGVQDELRAVGLYLQTLMSDVADTRTVLRESRSQLMQAQKLASVGKLAASVAHEIRNPLTAVKMWLFSLRKTAGADPALHRKFDLISEELSRLEGVLQNFLEFSRPPALRLQNVNVLPLLEKTLELLSHRLAERDIQVEMAMNGALPPITADPEQLKQVLINLIWNSAEAMHDGGVVRLSAEAQSDNAGRLGVTVRIRDTGCGISEEAKAKIYEPFFTTKEDGAGLGLCIAAGIMARHGGRLALESSTPQETCFALWIPVRQEEGHESDSHRR